MIHYIIVFFSLLFSFFCSIEAQTPNILLVHLAPTWGGVSQHIFENYKALKNIHYTTHVLLQKNSRLHQEFIKNELPCFTFKKNKILSTKKLATCLQKICIENNIDLIHLHHPPEAYPTIQAVAKKMGIQSMITWHSYVMPSTQMINTINNISCVSLDIFNKISSLHHKKQCCFSPPFMNDTKFINFKTQETKQEYFIKNFSINIEHQPIISMVANFAKCKNHACLIQSLKILIDTFNQPVHIFFAGEGKLFNKMKELTTTLNLNQYIHFLGYYKDIPGLVSHSDIFVLCSKQESFGVAILEAALLKKPIIISDSMTLAHHVIIHNKTGLLFKNDNAYDLALKILTLINDKELRICLGDNAYQFVLKYFSKQAILNQLIESYTSILRKNTHISEKYN